LDLENKILLKGKIAKENKIGFRKFSVNKSKRKGIFADFV